MKRDHIIGKQQVELSFESLSDGFGMQDRVAELFHERMLPGMSMLFDELGGTHDIALDKLEIDCGNLEPGNWEVEWVDKTIFELRQKLLAADKRIITEEVEEEKLRQAFLYFIQHGVFSWRERIESLAAFRDVVWSKDFGEAILPLLIERPERIKRLVAVANEKLLQDLANHFVDRVPAQEMIRHPFSDVEKIELVVQKKIAEMKPVQTDQIQSKRTKQQGGSDEGIVVQNAGLVLLHPFLLPLFENMGLYGIEGWTNEDALLEAMRVLHWLARADEVPEEQNLLLIKLLCGVEADEPVVLLPLEDENKKRECSELLNAVIEHWQALRNTSADGLREAFLQRQGLIDVVDRGWKLRVENQAIDILLDRLPWGFGVITLPWMNNTIFVDWH